MKSNSQTDETLAPAKRLADEQLEKSRLLKPLTVLKVLLCVPVCYLLFYPAIHSQAEPSGILREIALVGPVGAVVITVIFLGLVALYCRDLQRTLLLVGPAARVANPRSVWLMFLLPYNFVEDFFIVANIANSLANEARNNSRLGAVKSFGMLSGIGWCALQIVSLIPHEVGSLAGLLAIVAWVIHWRFVRHVNHLLQAS